MPTVAGVQWLSWNSARLMALILNAMSGLITYFDANPNELTLNELFGLRQSQQLLHKLDISFAKNGLNREIFHAIANYSIKLERIIERGTDRLTASNPELAKQASFLLLRPDHFLLPEYRRLDERLRWSSKNVDFTTKQAWLEQNGHGRLFQCLTELPDACKLSQQCMENYGLDQVRRGTTVSSQLIYLAAVNHYQCWPALDKFLRENPGQRAFTTDDLISELCNNFYDETAKLRKDRKKLARSDSKTIQFVMEQIFVCGRFGFAEFVDPHFLESILAWQDPKTGSYTGRKPEPVPDHNIMQPLDDVRKEPEVFASDRDEEGTPHRSMLALNALTVSLRLFVDTPRWPELRLHDQELLVQMHQIPAEDKFKQFRYIQWVRDASLPTDLRLRPPPFAWSPDLIAFVMLAFIFVAGCVVAHCVFSKQFRPGIGPRPHNAKQFYMYAYKKL